MLKIFLSYAKEDYERVNPFYKKLLSLGFEPWIDAAKLMPGQNWEVEIERAFSEANVVFLFLSKCSVNKRGFVQREASQAFDNLRYKLPSDIYIIPILLEQCEVPVNISKRLQFINASIPDLWEKISISLNQAAIEQEIILQQGGIYGPFRVFDNEIKEEWVGRPGHKVQIPYPSFSSEQYPEIATTLSKLFEGRAHNALIESRSTPWTQDAPNGFNSLDNERWDTYAITYATDHILSIYYNVGWYGSGAAHSNNHFENFNYVISDGKIYPFTLFELFQDPDSAHQTISKICQKCIEKEYWEKTGQVPNTHNIQEIENGVNQRENLQHFSLSQEGITFLFSPYSVACYALGNFTATVSFYDLLPFIKHDGIFKSIKRESTTL